jgi:hypothetical protein
MLSSDRFSNVYKRRLGAKELFSLYVMLIAGLPSVVPSFYEHKTVV